MTGRRASRRYFLKAAAAGAAVLGFPLPLRAQAPVIKIGVVHPVTGPLAEPGQACRLGATMAAEAVNAAGGIKAMGGAKLELIFGDTQTKPDVGRTEAERVINQGAQLLMGSFDSGSTAAMVPVVQQRRVPFLVDIAAADPITANVAKAVKEGQQKVQYVYRNFPTGSSFGAKAVTYFTDIFKEVGVAPKRVVLMYCNDLFGQNAAKGFQAGYAAAKPAWEIVDVIPWPEPPAGSLHRGLARQGRQARHHRADHPTRLARSSCCPRSASSGWRSWASWGRAAPGSTRRVSSPCSRTISST